MSPDSTGLDAWVDVLSAVFMIVGATMSLGAAIGLQMRTWWVWPVLLVAWIFQLLTVPVSAHMVGRAGYRTKHLHRELLTSDELEAVVQKAAAKAAREDGSGDG